MNSVNYSENKTRTILTKFFYKLFFKKYGKLQFLIYADFPTH